MKRALFIAFVLSVGVTFGVGLLSGRMSTPPRDTPAPSETQARPTPFPATGALPDFVTVADRAIQASVNISSTRLVRAPWFEQFYGGSAVRPQQSLGSGVIVSADGYILTNSHVIGNAASEIKVTLPDNREVTAKRVGLDDVSDLAVVKIDLRGLTPLPWGDSDKLRVAEWVLAVGNPFAFSQTVTAGIVSAKNRHNPQLASYADMIQTDAAINPGNSGGALVNTRGELIGINTMIYSETGGNQGLGFAVPSNLARQVMEELIKTGEVVRGDIGLAEIVTIDADTAEANGFGRNAGVVVVDMYRNSPAHRSGLQLNDLIVRVGGKPVTDSGQLQRAILDSPVGRTVAVEVIRKGRRVTTDVPVEKMASRGARRPPR